MLASLVREPARLGYRLQAFLDAARLQKRAAEPALVIRPLSIIEARILLHFWEGGFKLAALACNPSEIGRDAANVAGEPMLRGDLFCFPSPALYLRGLTPPL